MTYGYQRKWNDGGGSCKLSVGGFASPDEARAVWQREAAAFGYTAPRWWQFWRWDENR